MHSLIDAADPLWPPKMTAERLKVKPATLATWRSKQLVPLRFLKVGRLIRYRQSDVEAFLDFCSRSGVPVQGRK
jgi:helix-turn-helix protein